MKKYRPHIIWAIVAIIAFVGGMYYRTVSAPPSLAGSRVGTFASSTRGTFVGRNGSTGTGIIAGQVVSKDAQSITIALPNGNSQIVFYSSSTAIEKPSPATISDITTGTEVMVGGTPNSDGSLTAQTIQVRPSSAAGSGPFDQ
jgi:Domain of unknown function (DUF5666)